jgi:predicted ATPase
MSAEVFVSYSSRDRGRIAALADSLRAAGASVWMDQDGIHGGGAWAEEIIEAINGCRVLLLALTPASVASEEVFREVSHASARHKRLLPLLVESVELPARLQYHLAGTQHIDLRAGSDEEHLHAIVRSLARLGVRVNGGEGAGSGVSPAAVPPAPRHFPRQLTGFIGREQELDQLTELLDPSEGSGCGSGQWSVVSGQSGQSDPTHLLTYSPTHHSPPHLVTLTGPGGTGKTRLALEVAEHLIGAFPDGIFFVGLAAVTDPELVPSAIAQALGLREAGGEPLLETLTGYLQGKELLLVLDNFEQVLSAAPAVSELLAGCPRLKVLVTSRAPLRLRGEQEFPVPPLPLPPIGPGFRRPEGTRSFEFRVPSSGLGAVGFPNSELGTFCQYAAVALFIQRAVAVKPDFAVTNENAPAVAEICSRLDGLPLAIELAASRIKLLPPQALLGQLGNRLQFLTGGARDLPARQQTLRNTIAWSYDLLSPDEQKLFRRLAVFAGGFTLEAAEEIAECGLRIADWGRPGTDSLGASEPEPDSEPDGSRSKAYAGSGGGSSQSAIDNPQSAHPSASRRVPGIPQSDVLEGLAALVDHSLLRQEEQVDGEPRFLMLETIREFGLERLETGGETGTLRRTHAEFFLALAEQAEPELTGDGQAIWLDCLEREHGNLRAALEWSLSEKAKGERRKAKGEISDPQSASPFAFPLSPFEVGLRMAGALWQFWWTRGYLTEGRQWLDRGVRSTDCGLGEGGSESAIAARAKALNGAGILAWGQGDYGPARALHEEALAARRILGDRRGVAGSLHNLGMTAQEQGDHALARSCYEEALAINREMGNRPWEANNLEALGDLLAEQGDRAGARTWFEEALSLRRALGDRRSVANACIHLGHLAGSDGLHAAARSLYAESLAVFHNLGDRRCIAYCLEGLAAVAGAEGPAEQAARLAGAAAGLRETIACPLSSNEQAAHHGALGAARAALGPEAFAAAWVEGQAMTMDEVIACALAPES